MQASSLNRMTTKNFFCRYMVDDVMMFPWRLIIR